MVANHVSCFPRRHLGYVVFFVSTASPIEAAVEQRVQDPL